MVVAMVTDNGKGNHGDFCIRLSPTKQSTNIYIIYLRKATGTYEVAKKQKYCSPMLANI